MGNLIDVSDIIMQRKEYALTSLVIVVFFSIFNMLYNFNGKRTVSNQEHKVTELCKKNIKMEIPCLLAEKHFVTT